MLIRSFETTLAKQLSEPAPLIQILLGPRQVGKTTAAQNIFGHWKGPKIMVSADSPTPPHAEWIRFHWEQARLKGHGCLLIIDEAQKIPGWSEQVKALFDQDRGTGRIKVLLLGSSSLYLQKGLSESLAGRFELTEAPHWTFADFAQEFGWNFDKFLWYGAYPGATQFSSDQERWRSYVRNSIIEPVLAKDILGLHPIDKPALFRQTFELATQYPAQIVSLQKMLGQLQDRGNAATIKHYLEMMEKCFLLRCLQKYSSGAIRMKASSPKIIVLNHALIHAYQSQDRLKEDLRWRGFVFESLLGAHLSQMRGCELYYWRQNDAEVDYVIKTPKDLWALEIKSGIRVSYGKGLLAFSRRYPEARCEMWSYERCLEFLKHGTLA